MTVIFEHVDDHRSTIYTVAELGELQRLVTGIGSPGWEILLEPIGCIIGNASHANLESQLLVL